jgi:predicted aconitase
MLEGRRGWPQQMAMEMLVAVGKACGADDLIPVGSAHVVIDGAALGAPGLAWLERLVAEKARFVVPTTINAIAVDRRVAPACEEERMQLRMLEACEKMGCLATCSCNPFVQGILPSAGESVAWSESATAPFVNAVLGARTNREGATAFASALTGLTPRYGMHRDAERRGGALFEVTAPIAGLHRWNLLGALVGRRCDGRIPVLTGLGRPSLEEFVGFGAALAVVSTVPMYHIVGITPEAPDLGAVFPDGAPAPVVIDEAALEAERARTVTAATRTVDIVSIGCPHASFDQLREVAALLGEARIRDGVTFYVHTNRSVLGAAEAAGIVARLERAGVTVTADNCAVISYKALPNAATLATNSTKMALFARAVAGVGILHGSVEACVRAGLSGEWGETACS